MQISYATAGFKDQPLAKALEEIAAAGYSHVEISSLEGDPERVLTGRELEQLQARIEESGLRAGTVHAPMMRNVLAAPEEDWRREKAALLGEYLRMSGALGAGGMVIHPVPNPRFVEDPERPELTGIMSGAARRSLDDLVPVALESGVRILLENLPYRSHYPFLTMTELRGLVDDYPEEAVGLVVDTGHAWTAGNDPGGEIRAAGERLWGTHLQDVDGEDPQDNHWAPLQGDLDWEAIREALREVGYRGFWTFEVATPRRGESPAELARLTYAAARELSLHP
jgi:hexulose-6-phosphate isomerase